MRSVEPDRTPLVAMSEGIRATVEFASPEGCPLADLSASEEATIDSVRVSVCPADCEACVTEFSMDTACDPETDVSRIFSHGSTHRYRFTHGGGTSCPCECLGRFGCPVDRYVARDGTVTIAFYAADYDQLRNVVGALRERFPEMDIERLIRSPAGEHPQDGVFVERGKLTPRQLEVLETAYEMGYFERPRRANATEVAAALDINPSTFGEHLAAAETKILEDVL